MVGKEENAGNQHFLLFPPRFQKFAHTNFEFSVTFILSSANAFNLDQSGTLSFDDDFSNFIFLMALDGVSLRDFYNRAAERVEQDRAAGMCRLILLYTLKNNCMVTSGWIRVNESIK